MLWPCPAARGILVLFCCHSIAESRPTLCDPKICNMPGSSVLHYRLLKLTSIESVMPSNHLILCCPLLLLPSIFPSISVFSNEYSGLISFRIDWFDLLAVHGSRRSLLQHHGLKASILWCSTFIMVQLSDPYVTTGKTIALTRQTFVSKMMTLLFICCLVCHSFPFNFMAAVTICSDFRAQENKSRSPFLFFPHLFAMK